MSANLGAQVAASPEPVPGSPYVAASSAPLTRSNVWVFRMIGHADPGLLPRVVATVAKLALVPERCAFARRGDGLASIELVVADLARAQAEHLRLVYATMPCMRAVDLTPDAGQRQGSRG